MEERIASLGIEVDSTQPASAAGNLDKLADSSVRAESAVEQLAAEARAAMAGLGGLGASAGGLNSALGAVGQMLDIVDATISDVAAASRAAAGATDAATTAFRAEAQAAERTGGALREMADAIKEAEQREMAAARASQTFAQEVQAAGAAAKKAEAQVEQAAMSFNDFYDEANRNFASQYVNQMNSVGNAHGKVGRTARLTASEMLNLSRQLADVGVSAAMGMNPLMILIQQGPQVADVFQTASARGMGFKAVMLEIAATAGPIAAVAGPILLVAGAIAALSIAALQGEKDQNNFVNAIAITGNYAGLTASAYEDMAQRIGKSTEANIGQARAVVLQLVQSSRVPSEAMQLMAEDILRISDYSGRTTEDVAADFIKMGDDVSAFATKYTTEYDLIGFAQLQHIRNLEEQGRTTDAVMAAITAMHERLGEIGPKNLGLLERAWDGVADSIHDAWEELKNFGKESGVEEKIGALNSQITTGYANLQGASKGQVEYRLPRIQALERERDALLEVKRVDDAREAAKGQSRQREKDAADAADRLSNSWANYADNQSRANREVENYRRDIAALRAQDPFSPMLPSKAKQAEVEAGIHKRYEPAANAAAKAADRAGDAAARRAEQLAREAEAVEATIDGNLKLAAAYQLTEAEAFREIATVKATADAIKKRGDVEEFVSRQIRLNVSEQAVAGAKTLAALNAETEARRVANDQVAAGTMTVKEANDQVRQEAVLRPLIAAWTAAEGEAKTQLLDIIDKLRAAQAKSNDEAARGAALAQHAANADSLAMLKYETELVGENTAEREMNLARREEELRLRRQFGDAFADSAEGQQLIDDAEKMAEAQWNLNAAQKAYNDSLNFTQDLLDQIDSHAQSAASNLADGFSNADQSVQRLVKSMGSLLTAVTGFGARDHAIREQMKRDIKEVTVTANADERARLLSERRIREISLQANREIAKSRIDSYGDMAGAAKGFFGEQTVLYKALEAAEMSFRALEFAMSVKSMLQGTTETGLHLANAATKSTTEVGLETAFRAIEAVLSGQAMVQSTAETAVHVANSNTKAGASTVAGAAKAFEDMGIWGFVGAAAILAFMAALGVNAGGGGGAKSISAKANQERQGTGSVLGDAAAKSESITKSLDLVAEHTNDQLEYSNAMLRALRGIESQMEAVTAVLARALSIGGVLDEKALKGMGTTVLDNGKNPTWITANFAPGGFDPGGLFTQSVTKKLVDQGLQFATQSLDALLSGGIDASFFQTVETRSKKKAFGYTYSDKLKNKTTLTDVDDDLQRQLTLIVGGLREGVLAAAGVLGVDGAEAVLASFSVQLGQISLKGLKGDEINDALEAVFGKLGDDMAGAVIPGLTDLQKVGEGLFETLMRVARQYQVVDTTLASIGKTFGAVGLASLAARENLVDLFGSLDDFVSQVSFYSENFLSEAERLAPIQAALNAELARMGIVGLDTRDEFKALVQGLDLSTAAGAQMFAELMAIAAAFAAVTEETKAIADARDDLSSAYERESSAIQETKDRYADLAASLGKFRASLYSGPTAALTPEQQYFADKAEFERVAGLAAQGNEQALGDLEDVSQAYLDASRAYFASSEGYFIDLAAVRAAVTAAEGLAGAQVDVAQAQLDQLKATVAGILDLNDTTLTMAQALANYTAAIAAAFGGAGQTPVIVTPAGVVVPATSAGTTSSSTTPTPTSPTAPATGGVANDNSAVVAELQAMNAALSARLERLEAQQLAQMRQTGAVARATLEQGEQLIEAQDKTVTVLRAKA